MTMESAEPLTTRSMVENSSCWNVGLRIQFPSTRPTRTARERTVPGDCGQRQRGGSGQHAEDVRIIFLVGRQHGHEDLDSFLNPSGNSGRIERSISRLARISLSEGRPSRLMNPPGILPAA